MLSIACHSDIFPSGEDPEKCVITSLTNDSALLDGLVDVVYNEVMNPLYYDACKTDERTDNLYNSWNMAVFDSGYTGDWDQAAKVKLCNRMIGIIDTTSSVSEACRTRWKAELSFLKSLVYYALVQRYGGFIIDAAGPVDHFLYPSGKRATVAASYRYVIGTLQHCLSLLSDNRNFLRPNKIAAQAMILRVSLQAAAYVPGERAEYLALALQAGKAVLEYTDYVLDPDYNGLFNDFGRSRSSKEVILGVYRPRAYTSFQQTLMQDLVVNQSNSKMKPGYGPPLNDVLDGWSKRYPTQNLVDAYLVMDADGSAKKWNETRYYKSFRAGQDYVSNVLYAKRDKRFYASIVYDSSKYFNSIAFTRDSGNLGTYARNDKNALTPTGYYVRKLLYETQRVWYVDGTDHFFPALRLGEVYLNMAEALLYTGDRSGAISFLNKTRTIHGGLPPLDGATPLPALLDAYKDERRVELFFENDRYWSLLRWAKFNQQATITELEKPVDAINISADGKNFKIIAAPNVGDRKGRLSSTQFFVPLPEASMPK
jgi:hypothetical protein